MSMPPLTIAEALRTAGLDPVDARILLQHVLSVEHAHLIAHAERRLTDAEGARYLDLVRRRQAGEPIAYLVGWREFYGRRFRVDPAVLIPRPETELLVELALARIPTADACRVLDLGTGSGNVAVTLALERPRAAVIAVDASAAALALARANARALGAVNAEFRCGDWYAPVEGLRFDLIVSNPPYVAIADPHLDQGDVRFEPEGALLAGADGLACIRRIVSAAHGFLKPGGWLLFEHGYDQGSACVGLLAEAGFIDPICVRDLAGQARVSAARNAPGDWNMTPG